MKVIPIILLFLALTACAPQSQTLQNQNVAILDSELVPLDLQNEDPADARLHLDEALQLAPHDPQVLIATGYFDAKMGDLSGAQNNYQAAIRAAPHAANIQNDLWCVSLSTRAIR